MNVPSGTSVTLTGSARMGERPVAQLVDALRAHGCSLEYLGREGALPLRVHGGGLGGGALRMSASISSQYVSSVLLAAPLAPGGVELLLDEDQPTSLPYIEMTVKVRCAHACERLCVLWLSGTQWVRALSPRCPSVVDDVREGGSRCELRVRVDCSHESQRACQVHASRPAIGCHAFCESHTLECNGRPVVCAG